MTGVSVEQIEAASVLTAAERERLAELEAAIARGVRSFVDTGRALLDVQQSRLYRESHRSFEDYCRERWDLSRSRAYQLIDAATVVEAVSTAVDVPAPASEAVARELSPLREAPADMAEIWGEATAAAAALARPVTAADVRDARKRRQPTPAEASPPPAPVPVDGPEDLRFAYIEEGVQILQMLPAADRVVWPTEDGDLEVVGEAVEWLAKFAPQLARAWREHRRSQRLRVV